MGDHKVNAPMPCAAARLIATHLVSLVVLALGLVGCSASPSLPASPPQRPISLPLTLPLPPIAKPVPREERSSPIMLGIDALEADGFVAVKGKRIGLLTHPAGVNRRGISTVEVLRRAPGVNLVALFAVEHGIYGDIAAGKNFGDQVDRRSRLAVFSLYNGKTHKPSKDQLKGIDALVIDLQDIGSRSYTFTSAMKEAMEGCFENGKEVIVLDRPNPLGGLKVDGPLLDEQNVSYVGAFRVPYVHGLTIGELAHMAREAPHVLAVSDAVRTRGKLTIVPMRGWTRSMRWSETGLTWVPTSPKIQDFSAVQGYPMTGLGCELGGFKHGVGDQHDFRGIGHLTVKLDIVEKELRALNLSGVQFRRISVPSARTGQPAVGLYIEITDYDAWRPTELSIWLMKLACKLEPRNPFATASMAARSSFLRYMGSTAFFNELATKGANVDVDAWLRKWREQDRIYQEQSRKYWLYK